MKFYTLSSLTLFLVLSSFLPDTTDVIHGRAHKPPLHQGTITIGTGEKINIRLAKTPKERRQGVSGLKDSEFDDDEGMLFSYDVSRGRFFWMPDTYFNLDIIFMDADYRVVEITRNLPHHPGYAVPPPIPRTPRITCQHVLELKATSPLAKKIQVGDQLIYSESK